jgi:hypothetical protein
VVGKEKYQPAIGFPLTKEEGADVTVQDDDTSTVGRILAFSILSHPLPETKW